MRRRLIPALVACAPVLVAWGGFASHPPAPGIEARYRFALCRQDPVRLPAPPGAAQSRGCVVTFDQEISDPATRAWVGASRVARRYLVYAPAALPPGPRPVVFVFPGYSASAEGAAAYYTHTRFEQLAERDGFIVVYGNGLPQPPAPGEKPSMPEGGFLRGCFAPHAGEGVDVAYVRRIVAELGSQLAIDRSRIYATGLSAGGGMAFELAIEAPDLVAAIAPVAALPFQPSGPWLHGCHAKPGHERISIAMLAATHDRFVAFAPGGSAEYPQARYPGMPQTRDAWLAAMGIHGAPAVDTFPDVAAGDSYTPHTGLTTSTIQRHRYPAGAHGQELWYYEARGMGHWWPHPVQMWSGLWERFGKTNQDVDFADEAWDFFKRHAKNDRGPGSGR